MKLKNILITSAVISALSCQAYSAGFQLNELSPALQGSAFAGAGATENDVSSMMFNPATLATLKNNQAYVGINGILPSIKMSGASATLLGALDVEGQSSQDDISPDAVVPNLYAGYKLSKNWTAGLSITAPWGLKTTYAFDSRLRNSARESAIETIDIAPTIAFQANDYVSLGAAIHAQRAYVKYTANSGATDEDGLDGDLVDIHGRDWGVGYSFGLLLKPTKETNLGISYRSSVTQNITGSSATFDVETGAKERSADANAQLELPGVINIGVSQIVSPKLTLLGTVQYTRWSSIQSININLGSTKLINNTNYKNTWFASLGANYIYNPKWTFHGGVAFDQTPTRDGFRDARLPGADRHWISAGATYKLNKTFDIDLAYTHIFMNKTSIDHTSRSTTGAVLTTSKADYVGNADILSAGIRANF